MWDFVFGCRESSHQSVSELFFLRSITSNVPGDYFWIFVFKVTSVKRSLKDIVTKDIVLKDIVLKDK